MNQNDQLIYLGECIRKHRLQYQNGSRKSFIKSRSKLLFENWISEKSLASIENGNCCPTISTLKLLSIALDLEFHDFMFEIKSFIPD